MSLEHLVHDHHHMMDALHTVDPLQLVGFAAIFSYSFLVSWHCAGMCGPLACSILARRDRPSWTASLLYNLGRLLSYVTAGVIIGAFASGIAQQSLAWGQILTRLAGVGLIAWAVLPFLTFSRLMPNFSSIWMPRLRKFLPHQSEYAQAFLLGVVTVLMPCMTLHPLLLASAGSGSPWAGGLSMLAFFLGTLPVMLATAYMPAVMGRVFPTRLFMMIGRSLLALAGIMTIARTL
ncbi:MAG TPA: sulfite exporter TauE/SafE family protein [Oligoflexus sp.]|uniref:sulfite exporter TauE/SafE family protein n=1 Tax=Oligoflexus sp. TaxID=1971216 RepID=UPI002D5EEA34|nr:sulfite exporter TauE/SafE family protein [Oligoflexus sp.]HYX31960.1 sulfite exporter TauE/SafE family protein [Oligoflexus sp.]